MRGDESNGGNVQKKTKKTTKELLNLLIPHPVLALHLLLPPPPYPHPPSVAGLTNTIPSTLAPPPPWGPEISTDLVAMVTATAGETC